MIESKKEDYSESNKSNNGFINYIKKDIIDIFVGRERVSIDVSSPEDDLTIKGDYQIAICQDGKFAVTFDTGKIQLKSILPINKK
jgi:hypothetical protein